MLVWSIRNFIMAGILFNQASDAARFWLEEQCDNYQSCLETYNQPRRAFRCDFKKGLILCFEDTVKDQIVAPQFYQKFAELKLVGNLLSSDHDLLVGRMPGKPGFHQGPDFKICLDSQTYYVEIISPWLGDSEDIGFRVADINEVSVFASSPLPGTVVGREQVGATNTYNQIEYLACRITNAIDTKIKKYRENYAAKNLAEEKYIIAVDLGAFPLGLLSDYWREVTNLLFILKKTSQATRPLLDLSEFDFLPAIWLYQNDPLQQMIPVDSLSGGDRYHVSLPDEHYIKVPSFINDMVCLHNNGAKHPIRNKLNCFRHEICFGKRLVEP